MFSGRRCEGVTAAGLRFSVAGLKPPQPERKVHWERAAGERWIEEFQSASRATQDTC